MYGDNSVTILHNIIMPPLCDKVYTYIDKFCHVVLLLAGII